MGEQSRPYSVRIRGPLACFSRPEFKAERVSYPIPTPSAVRGILEAILWKPAIRWNVESIQLLGEIQTIQFRRNEVNSRASDRRANQVAKSGEAWNYYADEDRTQRNTVALKNVDYAVTARMELTGRMGPDDSLSKFEQMFARRLSKGQCVTPPVLGCREFPAIVEAYEGTPEPVKRDEDFGWMLHDIRFGEENRPVFFQAVMQQGKVAVPPFPQSGDVAR